MLDEEPVTIGDVIPQVLEDILDRAWREELGQRLQELDNAYDLACVLLQHQKASVGEFARLLQLRDEVRKEIVATVTGRPGHVDW